MLRALSSTLFFILLLGLSACNTSSQQPAGNTSGINNGYVNQRSSNSSGSTLGMQKSQSVIFTQVESKNYKISPMDKLDISVFQISDLNRTVEVNQSGTISLPLIGVIHAAGLSTEELQKQIEGALAKDYLQNPQVTVSIKEYSNRNITVSGQVGRPGVFPITGQITLLQAIAMGGGITPIGDPSSVLVFRNNNSMRYVARFDIDNINQNGNIDPNLQPGDIVVVDSSRARVFLKDTRDVLPFVGMFIAIAAL